MLPTYAEGTYSVRRGKLSIGGSTPVQLGFDSATLVEEDPDGGIGVWEFVRGEETYTYAETTYAEYATYYCLGENANRDWTFPNPGIGAATNTLIAADFEIFVPEDASGMLLGSLYKYNDGTDEYRDLILYTIDTAAGTIGIGENATGATFTKGQWNTISIVINVKTGAASIFINNVWAVDGDLGATKISFMSNNWVVAKITAEYGKADTLKGDILLDDIRMFSVTDELIEINKDRENFISATFNGEPVEEGDRYFITDDVDAYVEETFDMETYADMLDASNMKDYELVFRDVAPAGIRFTTEVDEDLLDQLIEEYGEENVKIGTVILPADTVAGWETITIRQLDAANKVYRNIEFKEYFDDGIIAASIANIAEKNATRDFRAMTYIEVTISEMGNTATICSDLMTANIAKVAVDYLDENDDLEGALGELVEYYASFHRG